MTGSGQSARLELHTTMVNRISLLLTAACILCGSAAAFEAPVLSRLTPGGGQRGSTVTARIDGKAGSESALANSVSGELQLRFTEKRDALEISIPADASPGVHWIRLWNEQGASELCPFIVGVIPEIAEQESNDRLAEAVELQLPGVTVNGVLEKSNDVDSYAVQLNAGETLVASMTANRILGSPMDAILQITDPNGIVLAQNDDDITSDPLATFTAPQDGTWHVRTFAFPSAPNSTIGFAGAATYVYRLTLSTDAVVHHTEPIVRQQGTGDQRVLLRGWNITVPEAVLAADSNVLTGQFALPRVVRSVSEPVFVEDQLESAVLPVPVALSGRLVEQRTDQFQIDVTKGSRLRFRVECRRHDSLMDPVLRIHDSAGKQLQESDDISRSDSDIDLVLTAPADDRLTISLTDRFLVSGERYFYVLRISEPQPECEVTTEGTAFTVPADGELRIPLTVSRLQGYAEKLGFEVSGLPEHLSAEATISEKSGDTAKKAEVTLKNTGGTAWSGEIRIQATGEESGTGFAVVWNAPDGSLQHRFWLTAIAAAAK